MRAVVVALLGLLASAPLHLHAQASAAKESSEQAEARRQFDALGWVHGPQHVELFNNSALDIPEGYRFLNPADTTKFLAMTRNLGDGKEYFIAPEDMHWGAYFSYSDDGYVKDTDKIDSDAILKSIKQGTEAANEERKKRGWDEMAVTGWQTAPHYDASTKQLEWAIAGKDLANNRVAVNFNTRILGRGGVMSVLLIANPDGLEPAIGELKSMLGNFSYLPGQRYAEYKPGDKIAKYGLAALITGGAAAIAVKTGFWKVILTGLAAGWKFIAAGAVAVFGAVSRMFKRKNT